MRNPLHVLEPEVSSVFTTIQNLLVFEKKKKAVCEVSPYTFKTYLNNAVQTTPRSLASTADHNLNSTATSLLSMFARTTKILIFLDLIT
jgi:hypothetical protein